MEARIAAAVLFVALLACGTPAHSVAWEPYSVRAPGNQIAREAVKVGEGDLGALRTAGALPLGTLTMRASRLDDIAEAAGVEAAEFGGTHWMVGDWSQSSSTTYHALGSGESWTIVPLTRHTSQMHIAVLRVPVSGWDRLPDPLTPTLK